MKAMSLISVVMSYSATTECTITNAELTMSELRKLYNEKGAPRLLIKRAIKMQEKIMKDLTK